MSRSHKISSDTLCGYIYVYLKKFCLELAFLWCRTKSSFKLGNFCINIYIFKFLLFLQYSCLENSMGGGAWWAAVHGVAQSRTWLKQLSLHACIGQGHGHPLPCSCRENPRDGGAWWAAVYGVSQSQTQLKQLSSSSFSIS